MNRKLTKHNKVYWGFDLLSMKSNGPGINPSSFSAQNIWSIIHFMLGMKNGT